MLAEGVDPPRRVLFDQLVEHRGHVTILGAASATATVRAAPLWGPFGRDLCSGEPHQQDGRVQRRKERRGVDQLRHLNPSLVVKTVAAPLSYRRCIGDNDSTSPKVAGM
jgi:hypothetical protein